MPPQALDLEQTFLGLATHCAVGALICEAVSQGTVPAGSTVRQICTASRLSLARGQEVSEFLQRAEELNLFERQTELTWRPLMPEIMGQLAPMLMGARLYRERVHKDHDTVQVVLTKPPAPSRAADALKATLAGSWGLVDTKELLPTIAEAAVHRLCVMTPYLDEVGAPIVLNLFKRSACPQKTLICRALPDGSMPTGLAAIQPELVAEGVDLLNFRIERAEASGTETFHAKVVLADSASAYVGSANMNKWSFEYSLELGVYVSGHAAGNIARVIDSIVKVSSKFR